MDRDEPHPKWARIDQDLFWLPTGSSGIDDCTAIHIMLDDFGVRVGETYKHGVHTGYSVRLTTTFARTLRTEWYLLCLAKDSMTTSWRTLRVLRTDHIMVAVHMESLVVASMHGGTPTPSSIKRVALRD